MYKRQQFGRPISAFQTTQFKLADMQTKIDAARLLTYRAAVTKDEGGNYGPEAAMAKLFASDMANEVCREAVQLMGGYGSVSYTHLDVYKRQVLDHMKNTR